MWMIPCMWTPSEKLHSREEVLILVQDVIDEKEKERPSVSFKKSLTPHGLPPLSDKSYGNQDTKRKIFGFQVESPPYKLLVRFLFPLIRLLLIPKSVTHIAQNKFLWSGTLLENISFWTFQDTLVHILTLWSPFMCLSFYSPLYPPPFSILIVLSTLLWSFPHFHAPPPEMKSLLPLLAPKYYFYRHPMRSW